MQGSGCSALLRSALGAHHETIRVVLLLAVFQSEPKSVHKNV
jgi:hypothetical protein